MTQQQQEDFLQALREALQLLAEARQGIEGGAALLRYVNADLAATLRRRQDRRTSQQVPPIQQQQQQQQQRAALLQLPAEFVALQHKYASLCSQEDAGRVGENAAACAVPVTTTEEAAAGFLEALQAAYPSPGSSSSSRHHNKQQQEQHEMLRSDSAAVRDMSSQSFAGQACFVGLVAAVLSAVQELADVTSAKSNAVQHSTVSRLAQAVPELLAQCDHWLQSPQTATHSSVCPAAQQQQQQQQQHAEVVRFRNRVLRSLTAATPGSCSQPLSTAQAATPTRLKLPGLWLPKPLFDPLGSQQQQSDSSDREQPGSGGSRLPGRPAPYLTTTYSDVSEVVQHSKQLHKVQHILLQLAVEAQAAPKLVHLLLRCCQQLQPPADAAQRLAAAAAGVQDGSTVSHVERCCALYRLAYALTSGPVKQRGLGSGVQLAVEEAGAALPL